MSNERTTSSVPALSANRLPTVAGSAMLLWLVFEFMFRRGLAPHVAEILGTGVGAGALSTVVSFTLAAGTIAWGGTRVNITPDDWDYNVSRRVIVASLAGAIGLYALRGVAVVLLTTFLEVEPTSNAEGLGLAGAPVWALATFFLVNGVIGPVTEELAWRGVIQTIFTEAYGTSVAIAVTAVAFVLKHLIVDMAVMPFRTTALVIVAFGFCGLRAKYGTTSSTIVHVLMNSLETGFLILTLG